MDFELKISGYRDQIQVAISTIQILKVQGPRDSMINVLSFQGLIDKFLRVKVKEYKG